MVPPNFILYSILHVSGCVICYSSSSLGLLSSMLGCCRCHCRRRHRLPLRLYYITYFLLRFFLLLAVLECSFSFVFLYTAHMFLFCCNTLMFVSCSCSSSTSSGTFNFISKTDILPFYSRLKWMKTLHTHTHRSTCVQFLKETQRTPLGT